MNSSILVVGSDELFATLPDQMRSRTAFRVEIVGNVDEARSWIEVRPPDILLVQASIDGSIELCHWLKQQIQLSWIYCILLEDRPQMVAERNRSDWNWEVEATAAALEENADAYMWWLPPEAKAQDQMSSSDRLLLAQLKVGWRKVQKYRDLMQRNDALSAIALVDSLTQLSNRRALEWDLPRQIRASRLHKTSLSVIMLDVDYFKVVNDTYGHLVGDRVLQLLCARMRHNLRFPDTAFRYGGEEFAILLGDTDCQGGLVVARRLLRLVSEQPFAMDRTLTINVTISLGVASLQPSDDEQGMSLLERADQCLLKAKASGRNCVAGCEEFACDVSIE